MSIRSREQTTLQALLIDYDTNSTYWEAYQTLFANLRVNWESHLAHTLLMTTATTSPEHRLVAANLAITAANSNMPTILVDADLHAPLLQQRFSTPQGAGLSDLLRESSVISPKVASCLEPTFMKNLRLLSAGTQLSEGSALLLSNRLAEIVASLKELVVMNGQPGLVVFHTPAVLAGADASVVSSLMDQTVLGIVSGQTTRKQAKAAQEQLRRSHADLSGIVMLNR